MKFDVERTLQADADFQNILRFLVRSYVKFGESRTRARQHAAERLRAMQRSMSDLGNAPYQGTLLEALKPGLRAATRDRTVFYFTVDSTRHVVMVLAVFYGGQDHRRHMQRRLSQPDA